jgi:hypothetical protein
MSLMWQSVHIVAVLVPAPIGAHHMACGLSRHTLNSRGRIAALTQEVPRNNPGLGLGLIG